MMCGPLFSPEAGFGLNNRNHCFSCSLSSELRPSQVSAAAPPLVDPGENISASSEGLRSQTQDGSAELLLLQGF